MKFINDSRLILLKWALFAFVLSAGLRLIPIYFQVETLKNPIAIELKVDPKPRATHEPVIVTGQPGRGCFLYIIYEADGKARLGYDSWGSGGPISDTFDIPSDRTIPLKIEMPATDPSIKAAHPHKAHIRVSSGELVIFDCDVYYFIPKRGQIYVGKNPIGGSCCVTLFSGTITAGPRTLHGPALVTAPFLEKARVGLIHASIGVFGTVAVLSMLTVVYQLLRLIPERRISDENALPRQGTTSHLWAVLSILICTGVFIFTTTQGSFEFLHREALGSFYDHQAKSLLQGRLDVPYDAISGEAFVFEGRSYGYFGFTPALLRIPFLSYSPWFGMLSRYFMIFYFVLALLSSYLLLRLFYQHIRGRQSGPPAWTTILLIINAGIGSTFIFLGSRAYLYHEAILCGAAFALTSAYFSFRYFLRRDHWSWPIALLCGLLAIHSRPTSGLFALALLGFTAAWPILAELIADIQRRQLPHPLQLLISFRREVMIGLCCLLGVLSFNLVGYLKFREFGGFPLKYNVQYTPERLARFEGKQFHISNIPHNLDQYITGLTLGFEKKFPYISSRNDHSRSFLDAKIDMLEPTIGLPLAMPALFIFATLGCIVVCVREPRLRSASGVLWLSFAPTAFLLFSAVVLSQRYTGDFCPFLICGSCLCLATIAATWTKGRTISIILASTLSLLSVMVMAGICIRFQSTDGCGADPSGMKRYQDFDYRVDALFSTASKQ
ncbi:MAG: hypothetical protein WC378_12305 [Opitutaceae bacterium]|jgi:hypothetical protein